jgi:hypothetical protein
MTPSTPPAQSPAPGGQTARGSISPRKLILGVILAGSILLFFLILFAGGIAILREASPRGGARTPLLVAVKRVIAHDILHIHHHK